MELEEADAPEGDAFTDGSKQEVPQVSDIHKEKEVVNAYTM